MTLDELIKESLRCRLDDEALSGDPTACILTGIHLALLAQVEATLLNAVLAALPPIVFHYPNRREGDGRAIITALPDLSGVLIMLPNVHPHAEVEKAWLTVEALRAAGWKTSVRMHGLRPGQCLYGSANDGHVWTDYPNGHCHRCGTDAPGR